MTFVLLLLAYAVSFCQTKNRIALSYHQSYIIERAESSKFGLHLNLERMLSPSWSASFEYGLDDYCRCDWGKYTFRPGEFRHFLANTDHSSPSLVQPELGRLYHWTLMLNRHLRLGIHSSRSMIVGTGITWRKGLEQYLLYITPFEALGDYRPSSDWAIPIRIAYRYDPPHRWWGLTAYILYQGYFHYERDYLGNNPMNVLQAGVNFDIRFGKREELKRE